MAQDVNALARQIADMMVENLKKAQENLDEADERENRRQSKFYSIELPSKKIDAEPTD